jgi:MFS family permease
MIGYYIFYNLVFALTAFPMGVIADKAGLHKTLIAGILVFAVVYTGMGMASVSVHFIVLFALYGLYAAATDGVSKALITNHCRREETATGLGLYNALASIVTLISSSLAGLVWFAFGAKTMFIIAGTGALISALYLTIILRKKSGMKTG